MAADLNTTLSSIQLITSKELAQASRFARANQPFRNWCRSLGIEPVPGRKGIYDPKHVRTRLDMAQGLLSSDPTIGPNAEVVRLTDARRARIAAKEVRNG